MPRGGFPGGGGPGGGRGMMRALQEMQEKMAAEQEALGTELVEASVGGGAVKVVMDGHQRVQSVEIKPELLTPDESEMLADLLVAAVNQAIESSQELARQRMSSITQGLGLPPGLGF